MCPFDRFVSGSSQSYSQLGAIPKNDAEAQGRLPLRGSRTSRADHMDHLSFCEVVDAFWDKNFDPTSGIRVALWKVIYSRVATFARNWNFLMSAHDIPRCTAFVLRDLFLHFSYHVVKYQDILPNVSNTSEIEQTS